MLTPGGSGRPRLLLPTLLTLLFAVAARFDVFPWLRGPAPYPPEWQWGFEPAPWSAMLPALGVGCALLALLALSGTVWARGRARFARSLLLVTGMLLGWGFSLSLLASSPEGPWRTLLSRAASRTITSYHTVAVSDDARDPVAFLARHHTLLAGYRTAAKHAATHPPGPVLFYRGALVLCERSTSLTDALLGLARVGDRALSPPQARPARAAALLGALLLGLLGAATVWPIAALGESLGLGPLAAARLAVLYLLVPGPALMVPQFDAALALPVAAATALLASAIATGRGVVAKATLAGAAGAIALFTSYGAAVFLAIGGLGAAGLAPGGRGGARRALIATASAAAAAVALTAALGLLGHHPLASARAALAIHREGYTAPRSYALWLVFDPLDLAVFLGVALTIVGLARLRALAMDRPATTATARFAFAVAGALGLLVLSGVTRGEVGRIWVPLMPLLLVGILAPVGQGDARAPVDRPGFAVGLGALQVVSCLALRMAWVF